MFPQSTKAYNLHMKQKLNIPLAGLLGAIALSSAGCVTELPPLVDPAQVTDSLVVGRVITIITGERARRYLPQVRFLELENQDSQKRYQVEIDSPDHYFAVDLPAGTYRLNRVQISEGPFLCMADLAMTFPVTPHAVTHLGTWQLGVDSPRYGRDIVVSIMTNDEDRVQVRGFLNERYSNFSESPFIEMRPQPSQVEARLYEVMPYPRYPRYFRRHWW